MGENLGGDASCFGKDFSSDEEGDGPTAGDLALVSSVGTGLTLAACKTFGARVVHSKGSISLKELLTVSAMF